MIVKKFTAASTRDALQQVRERLGPDALILSNRVHAGGVEIMAMAEQDMAALTHTPVAAEKPIRHELPGLQVMPSKPPEVKIDPTPAPAQTAAHSDSQANANPAPDPTQQADSSAPAVKGLAEEVKNIRSLIEQQLVNLAWRDLKSADPNKFEVLRRLLGLGFSPRLSREIAQALPLALDGERALAWVRGVLAHNLRCAPSAQDPVTRGGVYALVGPTGVGKTTTIAKLAARCVLKHGPGSLALITTDSYRIGAHEQLKIYGKILSAPVHAVKNELELTRVLNNLDAIHLVLIDTAGMSQRDKRIGEQLDLLCAHAQVQRLLLLSATAQAGTLDDVVRAYKGNGLAGAMLTKIDEALSLAPVIDVALRHKLQLHYVTNGQRVPEDLHLAHSPYLIDRAFKTVNSPAHLASDDEYPLIISARDDEAHAFVHAS